MLEKTSVPLYLGTISTISVEMKNKRDFDPANSFFKLIVQMFYITH